MDPILLSRRRLGIRIGGPGDWRRYCHHIPRRSQRRVRAVVAQDQDISTVQIYENGILTANSSNLDMDVMIYELLHINTNPSRHKTPFGSFIRGTIIYDGVVSNSKAESIFSYFTSWKFRSKRCLFDCWTRGRNLYTDTAETRDSCSIVSQIRHGSMVK